MRLGTRARYGTRAMLDLALHYGDGPVVMKDVAQRQEVSESYLENLMIPLRTHGLVRTERGSRGGYTLSRRPAEITLGEIIRTLEGSLAPVFCLDDPKLCHRYPQCVTRIIWDRIHKAIANTLDSITLADLVKMHNEVISAHQDEITTANQQASNCGWYI